MSSAPSDAPVPAPKARGRIPKTGWDLVFTLVIPILILSPNVLGEGIGVASVLGGGTAGNVRAYLLAALIPVAYVLWDILVNRTVSPVALIGRGGGRVFGGRGCWFGGGAWSRYQHHLRRVLVGWGVLGWGMVVARVGGKRVGMRWLVIGRCGVWAWCLGMVRSV